MSGPHYYIQTLDNKLFSRKYHTAIPSQYSAIYGPQYQAPEQITLSEAGTHLMYTTLVPSDIYYSNYVLGIEQGDLLFQKGLYTVTLDLKTGEQHHTRTDLP